MSMFRWFVFLFLRDEPHSDFGFASRTPRFGFEVLIGFGVLFSRNFYENTITVLKSFLTICTTNVDCMLYLVGMHWMRSLKTCD